MSDNTRTYRGLEIQTLVYPRKPRGHVGSRNYDEGFDAAVKICKPGDETASRVFRVPGMFPFKGAGEARLASAKYAERVIDGEIAGQTISDL